MNTKATSVLNDSDLTETMSTIHETNMLFFLQIRPVTTLFCKKHDIDCLKTELNLGSSHGNPTYRYFVYFAFDV